MLIIIIIILITIRRPNGVTDPQLQSLSSFGSGFLASMMLRGAQAVQKLANSTHCGPRVDVNRGPWSCLGKLCGHPGSLFWFPQSYKSAQFLQLCSPAHFQSSNSLDFLVIFSIFSSNPSKFSSPAILQTSNHPSWGRRNARSDWINGFLNDFRPAGRPAENN